MFLLDRQPLTPDDESAQKLPELFDIHVMLFADTSAATVAALQRAFSLDASSAQRMVMQAPIIVKRAATPEVAAALFDVLAPLGAQVVLLPSSGVPVVKRVDLRVDPRAEPPDREPEAAAPIASGWGGLELELELPTPAPTPAWDELEIGTSDAPPDFHAQGADSEYSQPSPPSPPPPPPLSLRAPSLPVPAVVAARRKTAPAAETPANLDLGLGLGNVPPLPSMGMGLSVRPSGKPPPAPAAAAFAVSGPPPRALEIDSSSLRLPELSSSVGARRQPRAYESDPPPPEDLLPDTSARPTPRRSIASGEQGTRSGGLRSPQRLDLDEERDGTDSSKTEATRGPGATNEVGKAGPRPATGAEEPAGASLARNRVQAVAEFVLAILILYMGLRTDHSVLHGNANMLWVALHGLALFGLGRAVAGLRT